MNLLQMTTIGHRASESGPVRKYPDPTPGSTFPLTTLEAKKDQDLSELILPADASTVENISLEGTEGLWEGQKTATPVFVGRV